VKFLFILLFEDGLPTIFNYFSAKMFLRLPRGLKSQSNHQKHCSHLRIREGADTYLEEQKTVPIEPLGSGIHGMA
jgi:hypothetical protein